MILLLSQIALADLCPEIIATEHVSWATPPHAQWGEWATKEADLQLIKPQQTGRWNLWIPQGQIHTDGQYRVRVKLGKKPDFTILARASTSQNGTDEVSGYGLSLEKNKLVLYRWDNGEVKALSAPLKVHAPPKSIDIHFELSGNGLYGYACHPQTNQSLAKISVMDAGYTAGLWGIRVNSKQSKDTLIKQALVSPQSTMPSVDGAPDIFGREVLVEISEGVTIPEGLKSFRLEFPVYAGQWLLLPDRNALTILEREGIAIRSVRGRIPYWARNDAYRFQSPYPVPVGDGYKLDGSYKDPRMVFELLKAYHLKYPDITALHNLGNSRQGRPIWALRITDNPNKDEAEPSVLMVAAHHGSELLSTEYALDSIDEILQNAEGTNSEWIDNLDMWVIPLVNPDGNACLWEVDENFGRKNCWDMNSDGLVEATEGVDLNRNYPFGWGILDEKGSRTWARSNYYRGPEAGSEPEVQAILTWAQSYQPAVVISWHTMGNMILSPYTIDGYTPLSPDIPWQIAEQLLDGLPAPVGRKTAPRLKRKMYSVDGVDQDWHLYNHGAMAYIVEGSHHNPLNQNIRNASVSLYRPIRNRLLNHLESGPAIRLQVLDSDNRPIKAKIEISEIQMSNKEVWHTRYHDGRWDFLVPEHGQYSLTLTAPGYRTKKVVVQTQDRVEIVMQP